MSHASEQAALEALRASEERFRQLAENIREVFWMTSADKSEILYVSPRYEEVWGRSCRSLIDEPFSWLDAIQPADRARVEAALPDQRLGTTEATYRIVRPDGSERWIRDRSFPIRDDDGDVRRIVGIAEDITQTILANERLRHADRLEAVAQLASGVAHDFNNLLSVILSYAEFLLESTSTTDPRRSDLEEIRRAGERAAELTRQLLTFGRKQAHEPRPIDLRDTVQRMANMLRRTLTEDVDLVISSPTSLGSVLADPGQIEQLVLNLVLNAGDAMPSGGTLRIEVSDEHVSPEEAAKCGGPPGAYVKLVVEDDGVGMDDETRARIFEPFFTTKCPGKGTGLGLSSVFGIVQQSGGKICVESAPSRGTRFSIYFPSVSEAIQRESVRAAELTDARGSETILVVEDDERVRTVAKSILRRLGYEVLVASNAGEALLLSEDHPWPIHLLITDVVMPRMSGRRLAARLMAARPEMRSLYMSGYAHDSLGHHAVLDPDVAFIQKPITPEALARRVRDVLDAPLRWGG